MKFPYKHVAFDLETTDVDPVVGEIIQIGAVILNEDCSTGETFSAYVRPKTGHRNPQAMAVNKINEVELVAAQPMEVVLPMFETFACGAVDTSCPKCEKRNGNQNAGSCFSCGVGWVGGKSPVLAAWASYFDVPFLKSAYDRAGRKFPFSYKNLDLKAIAQWEAAKREMILNPGAGSGISGYLDALGLQFDGTAHDGLDDIVNSIRIIQAFADASESGTKNI